MVPTVSGPTGAAPESSDDRWGSRLLVILAAVGIAICGLLAYVFPAPPDWGVQHSEPFELRAGVEGTWVPRYHPASTRAPWRRLCVSGEGNMYELLGGRGARERLRDVDVRVVVRITPRDAVCDDYLRDHGVDGWIPAESSWELQVDPPRVERIDWRAEPRAGAVGPGSGDRARLAIIGPEDSVIDLQTPATIAALALALAVFLPALAWSCRR